MSTPQPSERRFVNHAGALLANARRVSRAHAAGYRPPPRVSVAEWAVRYRKFPDDGPYAGRWKHATAPYLVEIMEAMSPHDPTEEGAIKKCSQSGGTAAAENMIGCIADVAPGPAMYVGGTFRAALDWAAEKFWPMVSATPRLDPDKDGVIRPQNARDGEGSTKVKVVFRRGGYLLLAGANSAASLRQHTVRYAIEDDLDQFPDDLENQGSPEGMVDSRLKVYRRRGLSKRLKISTPTIKGGSKIDAAYDAGDQRRYYLKCPGCGSRFDPQWSDIQWPEGKPEAAYLATPCCGGVIEHWQKSGMSLVDGWLPQVEIDGKKPSRHMSEEEFQSWRERQPQRRKKSWFITGIVSAFQTWADMAVNFVEAQGDQNKLKVWTNLDFGDVFEVKGDAPDDEKLKALCEQEWGRAQCPFGPVVFTLGCDVQGDGIYYELVGWAEHDESWSLDAGFLPGATDVAGAGAWADLEALARRKVVLPGGREYPLDQICVDAGYHTSAAESFCRGRPNRLAVFGRDGWTRPVLGRGESMRYETQGSRTGQASKKVDDKAYLVGTYGVKLSFYGYLRATLKAAEEEKNTKQPVHIRGRCHFGRDASADWFEQITSEMIVVKFKNGFPRRVWDVRPGRSGNHYLDCRVYNFAAAEKLKLATLTDSDWQTVRAERYAAKDPEQGDLLEASMRPRSTAETKARDVAPAWIETEKEYL
jgi:phage terminase large subunit GpA-like protein